MKFSKRILWFNNDDEENDYIDNHYPIKEQASETTDTSSGWTIMVTEGMSLYDLVFYLILGYLII